MASNVKATVKGTKLIVEIDLGRAAVNAARPSSTGKSRLLASTEGTMAIEGSPVNGTKLALNVMIPNA